MCSSVLKKLLYSPDTVVNHIGLLIGSALGCLNQCVGANAGKQDSPVAQAADA